MSAYNGQTNSAVEWLLLEAYRTNRVIAYVFLLGDFVPIADPPVKEAAR
jgi:hypothetical protein